MSMCEDGNCPECVSNREKYQKQLEEQRAGIFRKRPSQVARMKEVAQQMPSKEQIAAQMFVTEQEAALGRIFAQVDSITARQRRERHQSWLDSLKHPQ